MRKVERKEKKYLIDIATAERLRFNLSSIVTPDSHNGSSGYPVRSLYFDTPHDRDFVEKLFGLDPRRKVRLRTYAPTSDFALLELKQKQGDSQLKRSLRVNREEAAQLMAGDYDFLYQRPEPFAHEIAGLMSINGYRPKTIVEYDRLAFVGQVNRLRITLDRNIRATELEYGIFDSHLPLYPVFDPFNVVLEVKYNGFLLSYIQQALNLVDKSEISVSKYCLGRSVTLDYQF